jgi:hypothetical protein
VNYRKPRVQNPVVSRYPAPALIDDFVLLFLPPCGPHLTPLATGSPESGLLVSPLLGGPARHIPFAPTLHLHQRKSSRNLHLQYSAKSQSTPCCQSLITAKSDHPRVLGRSSPHPPPVDDVGARGVVGDVGTSASHAVIDVDPINATPGGRRKAWSRTRPRLTKHREVRGRLARRYLILLRQA